MSTSRPLVTFTVQVSRLYNVKHQIALTFEKPRALPGRRVKYSSLYQACTGWVPKNTPPRLSECSVSDNHIFYVSSAYSLPLLNGWRSLSSLSQENGTSNSYEVLHATSLT